MNDIVLYGTTLVGFLVVVLIVFVLESKKRQNRYYKEKELMQAQFEQVLLQSQLEIQEQTFKHISQEIHDNIGQVLTLAKLNINTMHSCNGKDLDQKIDDTKELVGKAIVDLRDLSKSLNTDFVTGMGLIKAIEYELGLLKKAGSFETNVVQEGAYHDLPVQKELILFRIFQEVINNIIKHSKASLVTVLIHFKPDKFSFRLQIMGMGLIFLILVKENMSNKD